MVLVIYLIGFGVPGLGLMRPWNSPYIWGTVALVLTYSAYVAEIFRSGIESIHTSQRSAGLCLGMTNWDVMRFVILPQAVRRVVPANMNMLIALQKDVALLSSSDRLKSSARPVFSKVCWRFHALCGCSGDFSGDHSSGDTLRGLSAGEPAQCAKLMQKLTLVLGHDIGSTHPTQLQGIAKSFGKQVVLAPVRS